MGHNAMNQCDLKRRSDASKPKTNLQRQHDLKKRRHDAGFRVLSEWVHDEDRETLKVYAKGLRAKRFELMGCTV